SARASLQQRMTALLLERMRGMHGSGLGVGGGEASPVRLPVYIRGFEQARGRFDPTSDDWEAGFHALLEVVAWGGAIRERLGGRSTIPTNCPELEGLYWVRNLMLHVGSDALVNAIVSHGTVLGA